MFKAKINRDGNIKLGPSMGTWSVLKGSVEHDIVELGMKVRGTCGHYCQDANCEKACYVEKTYTFRTNHETGENSVKLGHARNTLAMRADIDKCYQDLRGQLSRARKPFTVIRVNQSGELENAAQLGIWCKLGRDFPEIQFYLYTKAFDFVVPMLLSGVVPGNVTILFSIWHNYGIAEYKSCAHLENVKAFAYDDGFDYAAAGLEITTTCKAYDERGRLDHSITCDKCKKCFNRVPGCKVVGCAAH